MSLCWFRRTQRRLHPQGSAFDSQYLELDVYAGESRRAIVEIESAAGETEARLPAEVKLIWEVTGERGLSNHDIALNRGETARLKCGKGPGVFPWPSLSSITLFVPPKEAGSLELASFLYKKTTGWASSSKELKR